MTAPILFWFKRDLRLHDNPALALAAEQGPVLPVYIIEPGYWALPDTSGRQYLHIAETLEGLRAELGALSVPLILRRGDAVAVLRDLTKTQGITHMLSSEETGNQWTFDRDLAVGAWARDTGVRGEEVPQCGVVRRLTSRDGWAARRERFVQTKPLLPPRFAPIATAPEVGAIPDPAELGMAPDPCPQRQIGGRADGLAALESFLDHRGQHYRREMSNPLAGATACSRLSPYLATGALSVREVALAGRLRAATGVPKGWSGSLRSFQSRLAWRDHFIQKLEDEPRIERACLHRAYEHLRPAAPDAARLHAWSQGETGLPFVDACMRYLKTTGWLNFRMRSMVMAVASYHLWLDWRATGPVLARLFTDYEPGIHWSQVQMQSGTTGMNTIRIYNPVKQGRDQDPTGVFTRTWVPELADVPDRHLQAPWEWPGSVHLLDHSYPAPIIDVAQAARTAREAVWAVRKGTEFRAEAKVIITKHASRKAGGDRAPRRSKQTKDTRQLGFDFNA